LKKVKISKENIEKLVENNGILEILNLLNFWIDATKIENYSLSKYGDFTGIKYAIAILVECIDCISSENHSPQIFNTFQNMFDLINFIYTNLFENINLIQASTKIKTKHLLENTLKIALYDKTSEIKNYSEILIAELKNADLRLFSVFLQVCELFLLFITKLSTQYQMQESIVLSGWGWIGLYHALLNDSVNYNYFKSLFDIQYLQLLSLLIIRNVCGFAQKLKGGSDTLDQFEPILIKLTAGKHLSTLLTQDFDILGLRVKEPSISTNILTNLTGILAKLNKEIEHPDFLWTPKSRAELKSVLKECLTISIKLPEHVHENSLKLLSEFSYKSYSDEIVLDSVFVRAINKDPYMPLDNVPSFYKIALEEIQILPDFKTENNELKRICMIIEAINNLSIYQKAIERAGLTKENLDTLCQYIPPFNKETNSLLLPIKNCIFSIFSEASKDAKIAPVLFTSKKFAIVVLYQLSGDHSNILINTALSIIQGLTKHQYCSDFLIAYGFAIVLLHFMLNPTIDIKLRIKSTEIIIKILVQDKMSQKTHILADYIPAQILEIISEGWNRKPEEILEFLDSDYNDPYIVWNSEMKANTVKLLTKESEKIFNMCKLCSEKAWYEIPRDDNIINYQNKGHVIVSDIIVANYIRFPIAKLRVFLHYIKIKDTITKIFRGFKRINFNSFILIKSISM